MKFNQELFQRQFQFSELAHRAQQAFGERTRLIYENTDIRALPTPRESLLYQVTNRPVFSVVPFFYLGFLLEKNPTLIADIGCGANLFKKVIPQIHGIDPGTDNQMADEHDFFDAEFSRGHTNAYPSAFSICAIHFLSLSKLGERIMEFANIIESGGRGFLAMNIERMLEHTSEDELVRLTDTPTPDRDTLSEYVDDVIRALPLKFLVVDNLVKEYVNEAVNGNIRLVFEK